MAKVILTFEDVAEDAGMVKARVIFDPVLESVDKATPAQEVSMRIVKLMEESGDVSGIRIEHGNNEVTKV